MAWLFLLDVRTSLITKKKNYRSPEINNQFVTMGVLTADILTAEDKEKIKRAIPKASNKIIDATAARLYIAYPDPTEWKYTDLYGAIVLVDDLVGHTFFLKLVDIVGHRGVIWDQELYVDFDYNQDRKFFHTFEIEDCYVGLLFEDTTEAAHFYKRVTSRHKHGSKDTVNNKNAIALKKENADHAKPNAPGPRGEYIDVNTAQRARRSKGVLYYDDVPPPEWRSLYSELAAAGITEDMIAENREFIKEYIAKQGGPLVGLEPPIPRRALYKEPPAISRVASTSVASTSSGSTAKHKKAPPPPPPLASPSPAFNQAEPETASESPSPAQSPVPSSSPSPAPADAAPARPKFRLPPATAMAPPVSHTNMNVPQPNAFNNNNRPLPVPPAPAPRNAGAPPAPPSRGVPPAPPSRAVPAPPPRAGVPGRAVPLPPARTGGAPPPPPPRARGSAPPPPPSRNVPPAFSPVQQQHTAPYSPVQQQHTAPYSPPAAYTPPVQNNAYAPLPVQNTAPPVHHNAPPPLPPTNHTIPAPPPLPPTNNTIPAPPPLPPTNTAVPVAPPLPPTNTAPPPAPPLPPTSTGAPPAPPLPLTNTGAPPAPPLPPAESSGGGLPPVDSSRGALLDSIRSAGGVGALRKVDKSQLEKPNVILQEARGEKASAQPTPAGAPGAPASFADAIANALNQRKAKVARSDDEDDGEDW